MSIDYRLGPDNQWPDQIEDAKCAVRYLRANASRLHVDPDEIGVWGHSAGRPPGGAAGHGRDRRRAGTSAPTRTSRARCKRSSTWPGRAICSPWATGGPSSLVTKNFVSLLANVPPDQLQAELTQASPVTWVAHGDPPFLIMHSDDDRIVYPEQSERLAWDLTANGVPNEYVSVHNGGHDFEPAGRIA